MQIIGISGFIGSGKSAMGEHLVQEHGFTRVSFADALKDATAAIFGWPRKRLNGLTPEDRAWREQPDTYWTERFGRTVTPRWALQYVGTDVCRNHLHENIWVNRLGKTLATAASDAKFVLDDVRFPNEINALRDAGAKMVVIYRQSNIAPDSAALWRHYTGMHPLPQPEIDAIQARLHPSEWAWVETSVDYESQSTVLFNNHDTLGEWHDHIDKWYYENF